MYAHERTGNYQDDREVSSMLARNHAIEAEKSSSSDENRPEKAQKYTSTLNHFSWVVASSSTILSSEPHSSEMRVQADILNSRPDDGQATGLRGEHVNLIGALAHIDFRDSGSYWSSECIGAESEERYK